MWRYSVCIFYSLCCCMLLSAREKQREVCVEFRVNSCELDPDFKDNAARLDDLETLLREVRRDSLLELVEVAFYGTASPEGPFSLTADWHTPV